MREIEELMTPEEVAKKLHIAKSTVYSLAHKGILPGIKLCKSLRFRPEALVEFLRQQEQKSSAA